MQDLLAYESVRSWMSNFPDRPNTKKVYLFRLSKFCQWIGKDPDTLIREAEKNLSAAHNQLKEFYNKLLGEGKSLKTASTSYQCLRSFYRWNDVILPRAPRSFKGRVEFASRRVLSQQEISIMVGACSTIRDKALITFLAQSGQRSGVLTALKYKHVRRGLENNENPLLVEVPAVLRNDKGININKLGEAYRFAVGRDSIMFLKMMIEERRRDGEPIDGESWLFRSYSKGGENGKSTPTKISKSERGPPLTSVSIREIVHEVALRAGIQGKASDKRYEIYPHVFRRYWNMRMQEAGLSEDLREYMIGHRVPYEGAYSRWYPDAIRREWKAKNVEKYLSLLL